jgi:preprotein translocase SecE subunit
MKEYKAGQGSLTRLITWFVLVLAVCMGCVEFYSWFHHWMPGNLIPLDWFADIPIVHVPFSGMFVVSAGIMVGLLFGVRWFMHRQQTVDTLIETEMEMKKVSWPTRDESLSATWVVVLVTAVMTLSLSLFDVGLGALFRFIF